MKIAIIGAGAAGIVAAITAKRLNKNIHIDMFETNKAIGKKILASGNGRCNISNTQVSANNYIGEDTTFTEYALKNFDFKAFEKFCKSIGLLLDIKDTNKVYPLSNEAKSVVNLLTLTVESLGINVYTDTLIKDINKCDNKFNLISGECEYKDYNKVLISSGLSAAPQLGSNESGLEFAQKFEHSVNPTYPSLVGLQSENEHNARLQGVKKECNVSLYVDGKIENEVNGDVLFTKYGVSGFAILDISQMAAQSLSFYQDVKLSLNFFPKISRADLTNQIQMLIKALPETLIKDVLIGMLPNKMPSVLCEICKISPDTKAKDVNPKQIKALAFQLNQWKINITDTQGFKHAEVSGGGVRTQEVNNKSYESKKCKGLYFAGEVLDIVGHRGGFNLQYAWASGYAVGQAITKK